MYNTQNRILLLIVMMMLIEMKKNEFMLLLLNYKLRNETKIKILIKTRFSNLQALKTHNAIENILLFWNISKLKNANHVYTHTHTQFNNNFLI